MIFPKYIIAFNLVGFCIALGFFTAWVVTSVMGTNFVSKYKSSMFALILFPCFGLGFGIVCFFGFWFNLIGLK